MHATTARLPVLIVLYFAVFAVLVTAFTMPAVADELHPIPTQYACGAFSPDGRFLAISTGNGKITLFDSATGAACKVLDRGDGHTVQHVAWRPDGKVLASGGSVVLNDVSTGEILEGPIKLTDSEVRRLTWSRDGTAIVGISTTNVGIWHPETGKPSRQFAAGKSIWSGAINLDGKHAATVGERGDVSRWNLGTGDADEIPAGYGCCECYIDWHPTKNIIALSGHTTNASGQTTLKGTNVIRIWDLKAGKSLHDLEGPDKGSILCFSPDGKTLAVAHGYYQKFLGKDPGAMITLWDVESGRMKHLLKRDEQQVTFLAWTADGERIASGGPYVKYVREGNEIVPKPQEMKTWMWNTQSGELIRTFGRDEGK